MEVIIMNDGYFYLYMKVSLLKGNKQRVKFLQ